MKFGISNLSWSDDKEILIRLKLSKYDYVETVFPRINYGYYSTQSIFYGSNVNSFEDIDGTEKWLNYVVDKCIKYKTKIIVLGSPSLRKGNKNNLLKSLQKIDLKLRENQIFLCIEPNSSYYGGDYYFSLNEIVEDIVNFSNIKTMIDTHNLILEGEDVIKTFLKYQNYIKHIHFSEKDLVPISDYSFYDHFIDFLNKNNYNLGITYELKFTKNIFEEIEKFIKLKK